MRTLMKVLTVAAVMVLSAGLALGNTFHSLDRFEPHKEGTGEATRGNLDCSNAIEVDISSGLWVHNYTNVGAPNNVTYYGCSSWNEAGGEVVYRVVFPENVTWSVTLSNMACDLDLAVLDMCDENDGCIAVVDAGGYVTEPWPGEFYFVVDGYNGAACSYTITFTTTHWEPLSFCDLVLETPETCEEPMPFSGTYSGNTCDGQNLIASYPDCNTWTENGLEHYYRVCMKPGSSFTVDLYHSVDSAIWILDACVEPITCLAAADEVYPGTFETITYTHTGGEDCFVYLVIDSFGTNTCGEYYFDFTSQTGAVATKVESLSGVKTLFR